MLVIDLHSLQPVDILDLANQIVRQPFNALQAQDIVRMRLTICDHLAASDRLPLEHVEVPPFRNQLLMPLTVVLGNDQPALTFGFLTEAHGTGVFCENRRFLGLAGLKQIRYPRQPAGDIASFRGLLRQTCQHIPNHNSSTVRHA